MVWLPTRLQRFTSEGTLADTTIQLTVAVKPGWKKGTKITFPGEGDEGPNVLPADVVLVVAERSVARVRYRLKIDCSSKGIAVELAPSDLTSRLDYSRWMVPKRQQHTV